MSKHLIVISVGPVQDFISASRRTRDLWFGSELLSEISRAVALAVKDLGGDLIFPNVEVLKNENQKIANIILSELSNGVSPISVMDGAKKAAKKAWEDRAIDAKKYADKAAPGFIDSGVWADQVEDVIEFYAAWMLLSSDNNYAETRKELMRRLAGRKACRDFIPAKGITGRPKSSLDGARETIWNPKVLESGIRDKGFINQLRLSEGEQLDVVGLTKRLGGGRKGYPSVSRIAVDPWLRGLAKNPEAKSAFDTLQKVCEKLKSHGLGVTEIGWKQFKSFPYEGTAVLRNRFADLARETGEPKETYKELANVVKSLETLSGSPEPYLAILMADGDRMGEAISRLLLAQDHQRFSGRLAKFAQQAKIIVEKNHHGCLVYSGGDDVLAFVAVDECLECACNLHEAFRLLMQDYPDKKGFTPTLSIGIAIGHCMDPLEDLRQYAHEAEQDAKKPNRDGLAIHLHPRSGPPIKIRGQWRNNFCDNQQRWAELHLREQISDKAAYDLKKLATDYRGWSNPKAMKTAISADIRRMLGKKIPGGADAVPADLIKIVEQRLDATETPGDSSEKVCKKYVEAVDHLANEWLIARRIAKTMKQALGRGTWETAKQEGHAV